MILISDGRDAVAGGRRRRGRRDRGPDRRVLRRIEHVGRVRCSAARAVPAAEDKQLGVRVRPRDRGEPARLRSAGAHRNLRPRVGRPRERQLPHVGVQVAREIDAAEDEQAVGRLVIDHAAARARARARVRGGQHRPLDGRWRRGGDMHHALAVAAEDVNRVAAGIERRCTAALARLRDQGPAAGRAGDG